MNKEFEQYIEVYSEKLLQKSKDDLKKNYNIELILKSDFDIINANLINKILNQNDYNLLIQTILTESKKGYNFPVIISVAASLFLKNYCEDKTEYKVGDILQKDGIRYKINAIYPEYYEFLSYHRRGAKKTTRIYKTDNLKKYIITTADLSKRKVITKFNEYQNLFKNLFSVGYFPSRFSYKSVIILEKKSFFDELKHHYKFDFNKSIPFKWVKRNGIVKNDSEYIPIEPMIYLTSDYEIFKEHLSDTIENLDSVIFIGKNKYEQHITKIKRDIRREIIPKAIFIGNNKINELNDLIKWKWTYPEVQTLNKINKNETNIIEVTSNNLTECITDFKNYIKSIENEFSIDCKSIIYFSRYIYSIVMIGFQTRLDNHLQFVERILREKTETVLSENLFSINQSPQQYIKNAKLKIEEIFKHINCEKFINFITQDKIDIIIVPNRQKNAWEELVDLFTHLTKNRTKVFSIKTFMKMQSLFNSPQNVFILSLFGLNCKFYDLIRLLSKSSHKINYILHSDEKVLLKDELKKIKNEQLSEYCSEDRKQLCDIDFPKVKEAESIHQKIEELYLDFSGYNQTHNYDLSDNIYYKIIFENSETVEIDGHRTVLLEKDLEQLKKEQVSNLMIGDKIRIYENTDRKKLLTLAKQEDDEGRLETIFLYSKFWKESLLKFFKNVVKTSYTLDNLLFDLKTNGAKLKITTLKNWLDIDNDNLFPHSVENLRAIQRTINDEKFDLEFNNILKSRRLYRSIMISLGHNLSEELNDYIISKKRIKGEFLKKFSDNQIDVFLTQTAPKKTIKKIKISERGFDG